MKPSWPPSDSESPWEEPDLSEIRQYIKNVLDWQQTHSIADDTIFKLLKRVERKIDKLAHLVIALSRKVDKLEGNRKEHLFDPDWDTRMFED